MKGKAKLIRDSRDGIYKVFVRDYFWQRWKPLLRNDGTPIEFHSFKEFGEVTKIESFGEIIIKYDKFQGM